MAKNTSIFDNIKVSGALGYTGGAPASSPSAGAGMEVHSATGLLAIVSAEQMERLVSEATDAVVLHIPGRMADTKGRRPAGQAAPAGVPHRYVFPCSGIVFVAASHSAIMFTGGVRVVECMMVYHDGRAIGRDDASGGA